jgi:hypothetical protein
VFFSRLAVPSHRWRVSKLAMPAGDYGNGWVVVIFRFLCQVAADA